MQKCSSCGADLPENSRFCGKCGNVQGAIATDAAATGSNIPQPQSWMPEDGTTVATWSPFINDSAQGSAPAWPPNVQEPTTPPPLPDDENED
ncbi:MAG TPA: zinc ribbon domain-containing protein, partial [Ktedonobacteraceae bacterium]